VLIGKNTAGKNDVIPFVWLPEKRVTELSKSIPEVEEWIDKDYLRICGYETIDPDSLLIDIKDIFTQYNIKQLGCDHYKKMDPFVGSLEKEGLPVLWIPNTVMYETEILKELERMAIEGNFCHGGHPVLNWHMSNAVCIPDKNNNYFLRKGHQKQNDSISALWMALFLQIMDKPTEESQLTADQLLCFM
jgi:phage terminase large subunit-like protein